MARTTPAQNPRGEHSSTFKGGLLLGGWASGAVITVSIGLDGGFFLDPT
jgi:hypothetical protein